MNIKIINTSKHSLPEYETLASAGMDLRANIEMRRYIKTIRKDHHKNRSFYRIANRY